ncbi:USP39, partial [Symbiodinium sp. KB8]
MALLPSFDEQAAAAAAKPQPLAKDSAGNRFLPGLPGVGNLGASDYASAVVHLLARVEPLRTHFLVQPHVAAGNCHPVVTAFGDLMRRLWSPHALRATFSPHAFMAAVAEASDKRFTADTRSESVDFLRWLLRQLHTGLLNGYPPHDAARAEAEAAEKRLVAAAATGGAASGVGVGSGSGVGGAKAGRSGSARRAGGRWREAGGLGPGRSVITECFEGEVRVWTLCGAVARRSTADAAEASSDAVVEAERAADEALWEAARQGRLPGASITETVLPTQLLSLDLPPVPLFRDAEGAAVIPQVPLADSLAKFAGLRSFPAELNGEPVRRRYRLLRAPRYLLLHARRFSRNGFFLEKNPTIVTFPLRGLSLQALLDEEAAAKPSHPAAGPALARAAGPDE